MVIQKYFRLNLSAALLTLSLSVLSATFTISTQAMTSEQYAPRVLYMPRVLDYSSDKYQSLHIDELAQLAKSKDPVAQFFLAQRLHKGVGVNKDLNSAIFWYRESAMRGISPSQLNLGIMYAIGEGVAPDEEKARLWLKRATIKGDNRASYMLAFLEERQHKLVDAYKWYDLSARDCMVDPVIRHQATLKTDQLSKVLNSQDISHARSLADSWTYYPN